MLYIVTTRCFDIYLLLRYKALGPNPKVFVKCLDIEG